MASYELITGDPQRVSVGLVRSGGELIGYGTVTMDFAFVGDGTKSVDRAPVEASVDGQYVLIAGHAASPNRSGPRIIKGSDGIGVYQAEVAFDKAGIWLVQTTINVDGSPVDAQATFEVFDRAVFPAAGEAAPKTVNRIVGDTSVGPSAIDSRATDDRAVPDPELHAITIAEAIAARRPVVVVVSTPVYCVSRFCGPVTDAISDAADKFPANDPEGIVFVHLEVWHDFADRAVNRDAAEWIKRPSREIQEPWVFIIGRDGRISERFDNIVSDTDLLSAIRRVTQPT